MKSTVRRSLLIVYCIALAKPGVSAAPDLASLTGKTIAAELLQGKLLSDARFGNVDPSLMPYHAKLRGIFAENAASLEPSMLVESLYLHKKPARFGWGAWTAAEKTEVLNALVSISTLAGIEYYSRSRGSMRTFYEKSAVINDPRQKIPRPDPAFSPDEAPSGLTIYARQKDLSFGDNVYRYDYFIGDEAIIFTQTNCNALSYGIIPLAAKEKLRVLAAVLDAGPFFLIYAASMTRAPSFPGLKKKAGDSFASRAEALIKWFTLRIDGESSE
jgi:hypothetical protein